jgi:hypothetical protein
LGWVGLGGHLRNVFEKVSDTLCAERAVAHLKSVLWVELDRGDGRSMTLESAHGRSRLDRVDAHGRASRREEVPAVAHEQSK